MICVIALIVFGVLGVFSATHRVIAKEAFECVFRRITLRKCETGLDKRLKAQITGKLMRRTPSVGKWIYKHFELISWFFLILLLISIFFTARAGYYFAAYGNCNGPNSDQFCIFDPLNSFGPDVTEVCAVPGVEHSKELSLQGDYSNNPYIGLEDADVTLIQFGCFECENTKAAASTMKKIISNYADKIKIVYADFPLPSHEFTHEAAEASRCVWVNEPEKYWDYYFALFESEELSFEAVTEIAKTQNINLETFSQCIANDETSDLVDQDYNNGIDSGIYGTPTFFVNEESLVGAVSYKQLRKLIDLQIVE